nr:tumor necrosis factor receptor superfamily member 6 [Misgurnus anguillicaudatus]XP_055028844.1 tumor necrosis factor receptor superfamily member 6 [Misgurnus anguillicaudatus]
MEIKETCSLVSDTVCVCTEGHYCDKGDLCQICNACDTCEGRGVKIHCTATNNTVCNHAVDSNGNIIGAVIGVLGTLFIVALIVFVLWRKKICFKDRTEEETDTLDRLIDVDLNPYLLDIASIMKPSLMRNVARRTGMPRVDIEQHQENHPNDVKEQTYRLLQGWYEFQGLSKAYPTLIKTLHEQRAKTTADLIRKIVEGD